jgi:hypothetical protein
MLKTAEESTPCALSTKFKPDSRGLDPGIHDLLLGAKMWMAGTGPAMTSNLESLQDISIACRFV